MTLSEIVEAVNEQFRRRILEKHGIEELAASLATCKDYDTRISVPQPSTLSEDTESFAKEVWKVETVITSLGKRQFQRTPSSQLPPSIPEEKKKQMIEEEEALITAFARTVFEQPVDRLSYETAIRHATFSDPKFGFLNPEHPNYPYYQWRLACISDELLSSTISTLPSLPTPPALHLSGASDSSRNKSPLGPRTRWNANVASMSDFCSSSSSATKVNVMRPIFKPTIGKK